MTGKTLCIDFDGVLHSYTSGWKGADVVSDDPVQGAIPWLNSLVDHGWDVAIYSSRSGERGGVEAMKKWLIRQGMDPDRVANRLRFPIEKPAAYLTIDDRAWRFQGTFPTQEELENFTPWHKRRYGMLP